MPVQNQENRWNPENSLKQITTRFTRLVSKANEKHIQGQYDIKQHI